MRTITATGNPNVKEVFAKMKPFIAESKSSELFLGYSLLELLFDDMPEEMLTADVAWIYLVKYYEVCLKYAYKENLDVSQVEWFTQITVLVSGQSEEEVRLIMGLANELRLES